MISVFILTVHYFTGPFCAENAVLYTIAMVRYLLYKEKQNKKTSNNKKSGQEILLKWLELQLELVERQIQHFMFYASPVDADESYYAENFVSPKIKVLIDVLKTSKYN
jgi:hypothetical protein